MLAVSRADRAAGRGASRPGERALTAQDRPDAGTTTHYFEDLAPGMVFGSPSYEMTEGEIIAFAQRYDPQPFHTDPAAGPASLFGRHVASGWHTAAVAMRLLTTGDYRPAGGAIGSEITALRWLRPVVPGDVLHLRIEVIAVRPSRTKPDRGVVHLRVTSLLPGDVPVHEHTAVTIVLRRPPVDGSSRPA